MIIKYKSNLQFASKNFHKSKSVAAKFKGKLTIYFDEYYNIYKWNVHFSYLSIDLLTTKSWFKNINSNFKRREHIFSILNIKQKERVNTNDHEIKILSDDEINKFNNYINSENYCSTINNIIPIIKGSNPAGKLKNPRSTEFVLENVPTINWIYILDQFVIKGFMNNSDDMFMKIIDFEIKNANNLDYKEFIFKNKYFYKIKKLLTNNILSEVYKKTTIINLIKDIQKRSSIIHKEQEALKDIIIKLRNKQKNKSKAKLKELPFNFSLKDSDYWEYAHIKPVAKIKEEVWLLILSKIFNEKKYIINIQKEFKNKLDLISSIHNFLPLSPSFHNFFDKNYITWDYQGQLRILNSKIYKNDDFNKLKAKYLRIDKYFMTIERKALLIERNKNFSF